MLQITKKYFLGGHYRCLGGWSLLMAIAFGLMPLAALAVQPAEALLPKETKFCLQIPDLDELRTNFNQTQMGHMINDPLMQPFVEDLRRQLRIKFDEAGRRVGITWEELDMVDGGEICFARLQPGGDATQFASVVIVDVTNHRQQADDLMASVRTKQLEQNAKEETVTIPGTQTQMKIYTLPKKNDEPKPQQTVIFLHDDQLVGCDHPMEAVAIRHRFDGDSADDLASVAAYRESMARVAKEYKKYGDREPHARWFCEPHGLMQVERAIDGGRRRRGVDYLKVWASTGFREAIQGAGGFIKFAHDGREVMHRSLLYAPPVERAPDDSATTKYNSAARMLQFPHTHDLIPEDWIPRGLASFTVFNWKTQEASGYVDPLIDAVIGGDDGDGTYVDIKDGLKTDENGPMIDIDKEFFPYLDDRLVWVTDYEVPISTTCERVMLAVRSNNPERLAKTIRRTMESDQNATEHNINGHVVWEVIEPETEVHH